MYESEKNFLENLADKMPPTEGPFRLMPARAVAECVWQAYHDPQRLHCRCNIVYPQHACPPHKGGGGHGNTAMQAIRFGIPQ